MEGRHIPFCSPRILMIIRSHYDKILLEAGLGLLKQHKLFSVLYITGAGLAIAMTMVVFVAHYIRVAPVYPETNRAETWVLKSVTVQRVKTRGSGSWQSSHQLVRDWWYPMQEAEQVSAVYNSWELDDYIQRENLGSELNVKVKYTDPAFFRIFQFSFLAGKPFSQADFESGIMNAVVGEDLARRLFGTTEVVGKTFSLNYTDCRIVGVVKDASFLTRDSFAQLYLPYTTVAGYDKDSKSDAGMLGPYTVYFKVKDDAMGAALEAAMHEMVRKYNTSQEENKLVLSGPDVYWKSVYRRGNVPLDWWELIRLWGGLVLIFLLVPALNLCAMISTRMENRLPEMGICKAFGADRGRLLRQILIENLILTCLGGLLGLCWVWTILIAGRNWVFTLFERYGNSAPEGVDTIVSFDMLFSPWIFCAGFIVCLLLNLFSALWPAWKALGKDIVYSLNQKK